MAVVQQRFGAGHRILVTGGAGLVGRFSRSAFSAASFLMRSCSTSQSACDFFTASRRAKSSSVGESWPDIRFWKSSRMVTAFLKFLV